MKCFSSTWLIQEFPGISRPQYCDFHKFTAPENGLSKHCSLSGPGKKVRTHGLGATRELRQKRTADFLVTLKIIGCHASTCLCSTKAHQLCLLEQSLEETGNTYSSSNSRGCMTSINFTPLQNTPRRFRQFEELPHYKYL